MKNIGLCLLIVWWLSACSTIEYIGIETYNPAEVTFPKSVRKVLVVNNALPQPEDMGYVYKLYGELQDTVRLVADSALFDACRSLGSSIAKETFFQDVLLFHDGTRMDTRFMDDDKLSQATVKRLCRETGTDAIISFDRLLFKVEKNVYPLSGFVGGDVQVRVNSVIRSYLPDRNSPLATVYVEDSLYWSEGAESLYILKQYLPTANEAVRAAADYIGKKATPNFIPHWDRETRWIYKSEGARWKEATAYARSDNWEEAVVRWQAIYDGSTKWREQAKAAS
ncbi:MAG: DUF6340 family protein, partial [Parabacteroides sp.]|nr:DUF6340 family protein [Parabacteroides sp.]